MIYRVRWTARLTFLTDPDVQAIHQASLRILQHTGLLLPLRPQRQEQAQDLGLQLDRGSGRVRFPPDIVEQALRATPRRFTLHARNPEHDLALDGQHGYLSLDGSAAEVCDLDSGVVRPSSKADLQQAARIAEALPQIAFLWPTVSARDCPPWVQPLHELEALLTHSSKHVQAMTAVDPLNARGSVEMAAEVAGGRESLRARPLLSNFQCSVSPLQYDANSLEAAFIFGEAGIPTGFMNMAIAGGTAPVTLAGTAALANAEVLGGIVLFELFYPGVPTFYGSCATTMDMRWGGVTCGGPEDLLLQAIGCQMAHFYGLPASIGTFATGARAIGWHAGVENALSGAVSQFCGADMMSGAGLLNGARTFSFEQLLLDCEIYDLLCTVQQTLAVDEDSLALDVIDAVGPGSHFLSTRHTRTHMGQLWQPQIIERTPWGEWKRRGQPGAADRARERIRELLAAEPADPLPCAGQIREIVAEYEARGGRIAL